MALDISYRETALFRTNSFRFLRFGVRAPSSPLELSLNIRLSLSQRESESHEVYDALLTRPARSRIVPFVPHYLDQLIASMSSWTQDDHKLLSVPGPVEVSDEVLLANAHPSMSHVSPVFAPVFGNCLRMLRTLLYTEKGQPFIIAGSGTLGWDLVAANLMESGDKALVLNSGYFADSFADCIETYIGSGSVVQVKAPVGGRADLAQVEEALKKDKFKVLTFTHVDTCQ